MATHQWFLLIGCLMLARGLWGTPIAHLPFTSAMIYLAVGLVVGPLGLGIFSFDLIQAAPQLEVLTEVAVLISLFSAGIKMPVPVTIARWMAPIRLAWGAMAISILLMTLFVVYVLHLPLGAGVLLGAMLAPTDPVLASDVQLRHAGDKDPLRFALSCEAGMNDGSAFPFVMLGLGLLGLHDLGPHGLHWIGLELLWGTIGGIAIGSACGAGLARLSHALRQYRPHHEVLDDLMGLGLIAVAYGLTVSVKAWGFLAVFAAGVALRQTELKLAARCGKAIVTEKGVEPVQDTISANSLLFKEHLERLSELTLVLLLGGAAVVWIDDWRGWATALFLFLVARPASVLLALGNRSSSARGRAIIAWFGVRGIGSLYYLMYAINHGLPEPLARSLVGITVAVIMLSIVMHGTSVTPLLDRFWRR